MNQTFYCSHQLSKVARCLKTIMSSAIALVVLPLLLQSAQATFPPTRDAPPIPNQGGRPLDYQNFYFPDDLPPNQPSNVIRDDGYFQPEEKLDPKLFAPENQSGETGGFVNSDDTFDRYYSEDQPYIGPVATPLPDDTYVAQGSVTSKVLPDGPPNLGSSDIWVLTKGPDNQFIRERWVQVPMTQDRVVEVVNADLPPKQYTESIKSFPPVVQPPPIPAAPVKAPPVAPVKAPPSVVQQVWIRAPPQIKSQKVYQNPPTVVEEIPSVKQIVDVPSPTVKQYIQQAPQIIQEAQPLPPSAIKQYIQQPPQIIQEAQPLPPSTVKQYIQQPPQIIQEAQPLPPPTVKQYIQQPPQFIQEAQPLPPPTVKQYIQQPPQIIKEAQPLPPPAIKQYVQQPQIIKEAQPLPPPAIKQYVQQPQIIKEAKPLPPPPPPAVYKKSSGFLVPPPPPPPLKVADFASPKQTVVVNRPPVPVEQVVVEKSAPVPQLRHIWVPTSQNTGKFITVPVGSVINGGKSVPAKGVPLEAPPAAPIAVSDTWILKQDGPIPRFEQQKSINPIAPVIQKGSVIVDSAPKLQFESPKNPPLVGKSIDTALPVDVWPAKNPIPQQKVFLAPPPPPPPAPVALPLPPAKSSTFIVGKSAPIAPPPKGIISSVKGIPQLPPPNVAPLPQLINGKPCPIPVPVKSSFPSKSIAVPVPAPPPAYKTVAVNRQPFSRILRINRYPYGPYYVLNPRTGARFYTYPRAPIAPVIQQTKNGQVVRLVSARQLAVPVAPRPVAVPVAAKQVSVPVPRKQIVVPVNNGKSAAPVLLYPPANRIRYTYPWGSYIRSLPVGGKNIFVLPPNNKPAKIKEEKSSSSESSSSESSSSESKSAEKKKKAKEEKEIIEEEEEVAESIGSIESEEPQIVPEPVPVPEPEIEIEPEPEVEEEEIVASASEAEPEEITVPIEEPEVKDESIVVEESQVKPQYLNRGYKEPNANSYDALTKSFYYGFEHRGLSGRKESSDPDRKKVVGSYNYRNPDGIYKNVAYVVDANGSRAHVVSNEPGTASYQTVKANYIPSPTPENTTGKISDIETASSHENLTEDPQRD